MKVSHRLVAVGEVGVSSTISMAQQIKGRVHSSPFAATSFSESGKVPIYCWVNREREILQSSNGEV